MRTRTGPRQFTLKTKDSGRFFKFKIDQRKQYADESVCVYDEDGNMIRLKDWQIRKLRSWLNWYLDNK